eukprot:m.166724 g.166724  ORF g.166724 m.166724 type:complete len:338 (+) comp18165_c0_seq1:169-1182(+)
MGDTEMGVYAFEAGERSVEIAFRENNSGKFVRISEVNTTTGRRNRIIVPASGAGQLFSEIQACIDQGIDGKTEEDERSVVISSVSFKAETRIVFVDYKEGARGRFLKLSTRGTGGSRKASVLLAADTLGEVVKGLLQVLDVNAADAAVTLSERYPEDTPITRVVQSGAKAIHFEVGKNSRGTFLRLYQKSKRGNAGSVVIPAPLWKEVASTLVSLADEVGVVNDGSVSTAAPTSTAKPTYTDVAVEDRRALWVNNIPYALTTEQLLEHFAQFGGDIDTQATQCNVSRSGRPLGSATVVYHNADDARRVLEDANNTDVGDPARTIQVRWNRQQPPAEA